MVPVNYWAVVVAAVANMVLGSQWYGPIFGKEWARLSGFTKESMASTKARGMGQSYALMMLGSLVMSYVLAHSLIFAGSYLQQSGVSAGLTAGFWSWLGFVVPATLGTVLWEGKPWKLWFINGGYYLVALLLMGAILGAW